MSVSGNELARLVVLGIAAASLIVPFTYPVRKDREHQPFIALALDGQRRRQRLAAALLLLLLLFGMYVIFRYGRPDVWMLLVAPALVAILLIEILPDDLTRRFVIPVGRLYLVAAGMVLVALITVSLVRASLSGQMAMRRTGTGFTYIWQLDKDLTMFWLSVAGSALLNLAVVRLLREWLVLRRQGTSNPGA